LRKFAERTENSRGGTDPDRRKRLIRSRLAQHRHLENSSRIPDFAAANFRKRPASGGPDCKDAAGGFGSFSRGGYSGVKPVSAAPGNDFDETAFERQRGNAALARGGGKIRRGVLGLSPRRAHRPRSTRQNTRRQRRLRPFELGVTGVPLCGQLELKLV